MIGHNSRIVQHAGVMGQMTLAAEKGAKVAQWRREQS